MSLHAGSSDADPADANVVLNLIPPLCRSFAPLRSGLRAVTAIRTDERRRDRRLRPPIARQPQPKTDNGFRYDGPSSNSLSTAVNRIGSVVSSSFSRHRT